MKDIKSYVIGFLTCACLFLIMGQTKQDVMKDIKTLITENGRYQASSVFVSSKLGSDLILTTIIDTRTGEIAKKNKSITKDYKHGRPKHGN